MQTKLASEQIKVAANRSYNQFCFTYRLWYRSIRIRDKFSLRVLKLRLKIRTKKNIYKFVKDKSGGKNENYFSQKIFIGYY